MVEVASQWVGVASPSGLGPTGYGANPCTGRYVFPAGTVARIAFIAAHPNLDFSEHYLGPLLAQRGYGFLGWNTKFRGDDAHFLLDHAVADIGAGVRWLREEAKAEVIVLVGNSGGGSLMAAYQSQSTGITIGPAPGLKLCRGLDDLRSGDLYISLAAHPGRPGLLTEGMDPSVIDENDPVSRNPDLDMYSGSNGPPYSASFQEEYRKAQVGRNRRITTWALAELERISGVAAHSDRLFVTSRLWADLRFLDETIDPNERATPLCWAGDPRRANYQAFGIGQVSTLRTWLNMWSLDASQFDAGHHLPKIDLPALVVNASADCGIFPSDAQRLFSLLGSQDKTSVTVSGDHYFREPAGARATLVDVLSAWVDERGK